MDLTVSVSKGPGDDSTRVTMRIAYGEKEPAELSFVVQAPEIQHERVAELMNEHYRKLVDALDRKAELRTKRLPPR